MCPQPQCPCPCLQEYWCFDLWQNLTWRLFQIAIPEPSFHVFCHSAAILCSFKYLSHALRMRHKWKTPFYLLSSNTVNMDIIATKKDVKNGEINAKKNEYDIFRIMQLSAGPWHSRGCYFDMYHLHCHRPTMPTSVKQKPDGSGSSCRTICPTTLQRLLRSDRRNMRHKEPEPNSQISFDWRSMRCTQSQIRGGPTSQPTGPKGCLRRAARHHKRSLEVPCLTEPWQNEGGGHITLERCLLYCCGWFIFQTYLHNVTTPGHCLFRIWLWSMWPLFRLDANVTRCYFSAVQSERNKTGNCDIQITYINFSFSFRNMCLYSFCKCNISLGFDNQNPSSAWMEFSPRLHPPHVVFQLQTSTSPASYVTTPPFVSS